MLQSAKWVSLPSLPHPAPAPLLCTFNEHLLYVFQRKTSSYQRLDTLDEEFLWITLALAWKPDFTTVLGQTSPYSFLCLVGTEGLRIFADGTEEWRRQSQIGIAKGKLRLNTRCCQAVEWAKKRYELGMRRGSVYGIGGRKRGAEPGVGEENERIVVAGGIFYHYKIT